MYPTVQNASRIDARDRRSRVDLAWLLPRQKELGTKRKMGAKRQFDEDEVLGLVAEHFWRHGYGATKMAELSDITGLTKTSLYNAFGNKEALFVRVMNFYQNMVLTPAFARVDLQKPMARNLRVLLSSFFSTENNPCLAYGCLITNSILELEGNDPKLYQEAVACFAQVRQRMHLFFTEYARSKRLAQGVKAEDLTELYMTFFQGLRVRSRGPNPEKTIARSVRVFLAVMKTFEK